MTPEDFIAACLEPTSAWPQVIYGLPAAEYQAVCALNFSLAHHLLDTPQHFYKAIGQEPEETIDMRLGTMIHGFVLEGLVPEYVIRPDHNPLDPAKPWTGKGDCKIWKEGLQARGIQVLSPSESRREIEMCNSLAASADARAVLSVCPDREVSIFAVYRGVRLKARLDAAGMPPRQGAIVDVKKCRDVSPDGWGRIVWDRHYLLQAAWYRQVYHLATGEPPPPFVWLVVEDSQAAVVQTYQPTERHLMRGAQQLEEVILEFIECTHTQAWPGYGQGLLTFNLPRYFEESHKLLLK